MLKRKVGALIITILLFVLVTVVPYQLGLSLELSYQEGPFGYIETWFLGLGTILLIGTTTLCIGTLFLLVYITVLGALS